MRLSPIDRDDLNNEQRTVLEAIESGPRGEGRAGIGMIGPFGAWVRAPSVGWAIQGAGEAIRFNTSLPPNIQEVAICTAGDPTLSFQPTGRSPSKPVFPSRLWTNWRQENILTSRGDEQLSYSIASQMLNQHRILDDTYAHGLEVFGETAMIELVTNVGY